ncbi:hypothetical protein N8806_01515 [Flavobacteriaceae bacterium]|nr:hypothetical protein [Flavobacteriaceae bacterium]
MQDINNLNIRASSLKEFWGTEYNNDLYLWEGAKHNLSLAEIKKLKEQTFKDLFSSEESINSAVKNCRSIYFKYLPLLSDKLNHIHKVNFPVEFWQTFFGFWLYRHISIVYEKYSVLSKIDIDYTSIVLLDLKSFYTPSEHYDYVNCFCNDFGVQQLVSQYYYLFKKKNFPTLEKSHVLTKIPRKSIRLVLKIIFNLSKILVITKRLLIKIKTKLFSTTKPNTVLLSTYYSNKVLNELHKRSSGKINTIELPNVKLSKSAFCNEKRNTLTELEVNNNFEKYLNETFYYCFPKIFIENFSIYHRVFLHDISRKNFKSIVSSGWIGMNDVALYIALAKNMSKLVIDQEHSTGNMILKGANVWINRTFNRKYITSGWKSKDSNLIQGGFIIDDIKEYYFSKDKSSILFIGHTRFPFLMEFGSHASNSNYIREINAVDQFIDLLPDNLINKFLYRPRKGSQFWDVEATLELQEKKIKIDNEDFTKSILCSKIIIIDHISAGLSTLLMMRAPFLVLINPHISISKEYTLIFKALVTCGVAHYSPESAVNQLSSIYFDVENWWKNDTVQVPINQLKSKYLESPSKTIDFLLSV